ncbi:DUF2809 domain-containing protein [Agrobacterium tumefaciens]|uniref:ribosomal maturation YjgA family protein n=1 Tax=Agrobacterium tumefaciens TaxID=358 RepID=UPI003BB8A4D5
MTERLNLVPAWHFWHFVGACCVIFTGLMLRGYGYSIGLPFIVVKYGGSILWGSMVYLGIAAVLPRKRHALAFPAAVSVAITVESIRLVHFPALDAFRATTAGALLLGRVFSLWNIACYLAGIGLAAFFARFLAMRVGRTNR